MKIDNFNATNLIKTYSAQNQKGKVGSKESQKTEGSDKVEISPKAKEILEIKDKALELPEEVDTEKVEQLKAQINSGEYKILAEEVANKMLDEIYRR